jgi:hypothetical protein
MLALNIPLDSRSCLLPPNRIELPMEQRVVATHAHTADSR